jgi:hypothetical protein
MKSILSKLIEAENLDDVFKPMSDDELDSKADVLPNEINISEEVMLDITGSKIKSIGKGLFVTSGSFRGWDPAEISNLAIMLFELMGGKVYGDEEEGTMDLIFSSHELDKKTARKLWNKYFLSEDE